MKKCAFVLFLMLTRILYGGVWDNLWLNQAQKDYKLLREGIEEINSGHFRKAAEKFSNVNSIEAIYNRGNAYAYEGELQKAIASYEEVLQLDPNHEDAKYNLEIVKKKLKEQAQNGNSSNETQKAQSERKEPKPSQSSMSESEGTPSGNDSNKEQIQDKKSTQEKSPKQNNSDKNNSKDENPFSKSTDDNKEEKSKKQTMEERQQEVPKSEYDLPNQKEQDKASKEDTKYDEKSQAREQWLQRIPDDPGGLLRQKFIRDHLKRQTESHE